MPSPNQSELIQPSKLLHYLPAVGAIVAIALAWGEMKSQMAAEQKFREDAFLVVSRELGRIGNTYDKLENRTRGLEEQGARSDERFTMILTLMTEMKAQVANLSEQRLGKP